MQPPCLYSLLASSPQMSALAVEQTCSLATRKSKKRGKPTAEREGSAGLAMAAEGEESPHEPASGWALYNSRSPVQLQNEYCPKSKSAHATYILSAEIIAQLGKRRTEQLGAFCRTVLDAKPGSMQSRTARSQGRRSVCLPASAWAVHNSGEPAQLQDEYCLKWTSANAT